MSVLIWATLLFSVSGSNAGTGASVGGREYCRYGFCITLNEGEITAEAGLCAVIPCSFTLGDGCTPSSMVWFKCETSKQKCSESESDMIFHSNKNNRKVQSGFKGRVSLLEPDLNLKTCSIIINDLTESDSGLYWLSVNGFKSNAKSDAFTFSQRATVSVKGLTQKPTVMIPPLTEGQQTTLTCTAPGLCSGSDPKITWTWRGTGENDSHITGNITAFKTENLTVVTQRHSSTLMFKPSATQHHGTEVTCKVSFANNITTEETVTLNVTLFPKILKNSGCEIQSDILTCVCISEGFPLPTIKLPLLETHTEYSFITTVSNHTVNISVTASVKDHNYTTVTCVSSNVAGDAKENLTIIINERKEEDLLTTVLKLLTTTVKQPQVIIAFLIGILLSAIICCSARKCHRKKPKSSENVVECLEMVTAEVVSPMDAGQSVTQDQEAAERGAGAAGKSVPDGGVEQKEVEYSNIDFSRWERKSPTGAGDTQDTEYAELKKEETEERQDDGREGSEMLDGNEEDVMMIEEDNETKHYTSVEEEEQGVYSNVVEIMAEN